MRYGKIVVVDNVSITTDAEIAKAEPGPGGSAIFSIGEHPDPNATYPSSVHGFWLPAGTSVSDATTFADLDAATEIKAELPIKGAGGYSIAPPAGSPAGDYLIALVPAFA